MGRYCAVYYVTVSHISTTSLKEHTASNFRQYAPPTRW